ncbi:Hypothetical protein NTJ_09789 [Nesidiocoris tenuis]|uniref:Uncharacterized protein n=1 Tax=Nesidiocoris tenuis TaxID=355587 RepID=A0ABN7B1E4_9HEMI|nr:Hypothetical protein NTJ_09789 [Nesidiocoris tenuis]
MRTRVYEDSQEHTQTGIPSASLSFTLPLPPPPLTKRFHSTWFAFPSHSDSPSGLVCSSHLVSSLLMLLQEDHPFHRHYSILCGYISRNVIAARIYD